MAIAKKKASAKKKVASKKAASRKTAVKKTPAKKAAPKKKAPVKKAAAAKNKNGVKNSLVNNINAKKKKGTSRSKADSTISKKNYEAMQNNWGKKA